LAEISRVAESEADGKVKAVFDEIRNTLGVSTVGSLFEELAVYPWYLQLAWRNLKPNASTAYFHRIARELEEMALKSAGGRRRRLDDSADISPAEARLDLDGKLLTATAALRYGTNGQLPKMLWLSAADKQILSPAPPATVPADEPEPSEESKAAVELRRHAALCAESLPYRMEISATACRQSGLSEDEIDAVRAIIAFSWDRLPRSLLATAKLTGTREVAAPVAAA